MGEIILYHNVAFINSHDDMGMHVRRQKNVSFERDESFTLKCFDLWCFPWGEECLDVKMLLVLFVKIEIQ